MAKGRLYVLPASRANLQVEAAFASPNGGGTTPADGVVRLSRQQSRFAPWLRRLGALHSITGERDCQSLGNQYVTDIAAVRFERSASSSEFANPLTQRSCRARTCDWRIFQPTGHDQLAHALCGFGSKVPFSPALSTLHSGSEEASQVNDRAVCGNRVAVNHPNLWIR
jgi:hypothetical protein